MNIVLALSMLAMISQAGIETAPVTNSRDAYPVVAPDGETLLFQSTRNGRWALYTARPDGAGLKLLLDSGDDPVTPSWSPDGRQIAFAATIDGQSEIFIMDADGTNRRRLTDDPGDDSHPHFGADARIYFNSARATPDRTAAWNRQWHEIFSMRADGSDLRQHTHCRTVCTFPSVSPDGRRLVYRKVVDTPGLNWDLSPGQRNSEVFIADIDGANERNLTNHPAFDGWPVWSPDGAAVLFASGRTGAANVGQLYLLDLETMRLAPVDDGSWSNAQPSFSPDGRWIYAYRHLEGGQGDSSYEFGFVARYPRP